MILALAGCVGRLPFINEPPRLLTVNGVGVSKYGDVSLAPVSPGDAVELDVEAKDPEGHDFGIWFPGAWATIDFDPYETSGVIHLPDDTGTFFLTLELRDEHEPPVGQNYYLYFGGPQGESTSGGYYADTAVDTGP